MMRIDGRIFIAGHRGLVGSALVRRLEADGASNLILRTRAEVDLTDAAAVTRFFEQEKPEYVFLSAAKVGGIHANNTYPADFIRDNLAIQLNVIDAAHRNGVEKLLFLGSSCVYPKLAHQPISESELLTGPLEATNEAYAIAKIAGMKMAQAYHAQYGANYISVMPTNLYGPNDNFDPMNSHVLPALIRRIHEARVSNAPSVTIWGTGTPRREFMHVDDLADACVFLMNTYEDPELINIGTGSDLSIAELVALICAIIGYEGEIVYDTSKPDGTPRKLLDVSKLASVGWRPRIELRDGIRSTYEWYTNTYLPSLAAR